MCVLYAQIYGMLSVCALLGEEFYSMLYILYKLIVHSVYTVIYYVCVSLKYTNICPIDRLKLNYASPSLLLI